MFMRLTVAGLDSEDCVVTEFDGSEGLSQLFSFDIGFVYKRPDLQPADFLGKPARLELETGAGRTRPFNGIVRRFRAGPSQTRGARSYRIEVVPALWLLSAA